MSDYDVQAGQAALDIFHKENNELKKAIANSTESPDLLKALHEKRDQIISIALAAIAKATEEQK